jgi:hypothetical protein
VSALLLRFIDWLAGPSVPVRQHQTSIRVHRVDCWKCHGLPLFSEARRDYIPCPVCGGQRDQGEQP